MKENWPEIANIEIFLLFSQYSKLGSAPLEKQGLQLQFYEAPASNLWQ
jgi:hypothetical protein